MVNKRYGNLLNYKISSIFSEMIPARPKGTVIMCENHYN